MVVGDRGEVLGEDDALAGAVDRFRLRREGETLAARPEEGRERRQHEGDEQPARRARRAAGRCRIGGGNEGRRFAHRMGAGGGIPRRRIA